MAGGIGRTTSAVGIPLTQPLVDSTPLGSFWVRVGVAIATTATVVAIKLTRLPSLFIANTNNGAVVYQNSSDVAASNGSQFVCRATASTIADLVIG
jgi:hypothetical protein